MKRNALGKGLSALLPEPEHAPAAAASAGGSLDLPIGLLDPNPFQPRLHIEPKRLEELAASIRENGIVQPILVRPSGARYQIVAGERRWRAAQSLGLATVPVAIREIPDDRLLELALVENIQRQELTPLEEAQAFKRLMEDFHLTQEEIARHVGRDRATVANTVRLLRLPTLVQDLLVDGQINAGHARALLALERSEEQIALAREAARRGLSVREVERRVALQRAPTKSPSRAKDANTRAAEQRLKVVLGARVDIARRGRSGQLRIAFANETELQRLFDVLLRAGRTR
jgi:ParB family transcriptional regulator, chromosome partitioning protein